MVGLGGEIACEVRAFAERDVDVWLAEELRVNAPFAQWVAGRAGFHDEVEAPAIRTRVSVMGENGETDVEALYAMRSGERAAVLVENKIEHSLSADQLLRYINRGRYGVNYGYWTK